MKICLVVFAFLSTHFVTAQDTVTINFLYGSIPAKGYQKTEPKVFGGLKGGHVNIQAKGRVLDFKPNGYCHVFPVNPQRTKGGFFINEAVHWDTATSKWLSIRVPVTPGQMTELESIFDIYSRQTPYDYAVFGMRCAAASYDVLSRIGLFKKISNQNNIISNFYPKLLRKRIIKWASKNQFAMYFHEGKPSRKWESDEGIF